MAKIESPKDEESKKGRRYDFTESAAPNFDYNRVFKYHVILDLETMKNVFKQFLIKNKKIEYVSFDTETNGLDPELSRVCGFSFSLDGINGYYVPLRHKSDVNAPYSTLELIAKLIKDGQIIFIMFNKKFDLNMLQLAEKLDLGHCKNVHDAQISTFLRDSDVPFGGGLKVASQHYLGIAAPKFADVTAGVSFDYAQVEDIKEYACLNEDEEILTVEGYKKIKDIIVGDNILFNSTRLVVKRKKSKEVNSLVEVVFNDNTSCKVTPDHKFLVRDSSELGFSWVEAKDLLDKDVVTVSEISSSVEDFLVYSRKKEFYSLFEVIQ